MFSSPKFEYNHSKGLVWPNTFSLPAPRGTAASGNVSVAIEYQLMSGERFLLWNGVANARWRIYEHYFSQ